MEKFRKSPDDVINMILKADEEKAWDKWMDFSAKTEGNKALLFVVTEFSVAVTALVAIHDPAVYCIIPPMLSSSIFAWNKLNKRARKYWVDNWLKPYRTIDEPRPEVIDGDNNKIMR